MKKQMSPYLVIIGSFLALILIGTILLSLPFATKVNESIKLIDAFFLSTSAVTITGISTINDLANILAPFGKVIITILIKVGGLSVITLSVFIMAIIGAKIGITNRFLLKENLNTPNLKGLVKLVKWIVITSVLIELIGTVINLFVFSELYPFGKALAISLIQSIVAFNNSGFDLMGVNHLLIDNVYPLFTINTMLLVVLGGIGFVVIFDIINTKSYKKFSLHTKIVLKVNLFLLVFGFIMFLINSSLTAFQALFLSINARSAGFNVNLGMLPNHGLLILLILMFIGASPASTGSGIKTTTVYVLYKSLVSFAKGKETVVNKRLITNQNKKRAFMLVMLMITTIIIAAIVFLIVENVSLQIALHDIVAAISNAGLSSGYSSNYHSISKILISILMFVGRVGLLTIVALFNVDWYKPITSHVSYVEERIIIG